MHDKKVKLDTLGIAGTNHKSPSAERIDVGNSGSVPPPAAVSCANCKAVCCRLQVLLIGDNDVPEAMTEWSDWGGRVMHRREDGWCTALDRTTMRCTIYARRPQVCRDYEMGGTECIDERDAARQPV